jgi:hypothetical protein
MLSALSQDEQDKGTASMESPDSFQQSTDAVIIMDCGPIKIHRLNGRTQNIR